MILTSIPPWENAPLTYHFLREMEIDDLIFMFNRLNHPRYQINDYKHLHNSESVRNNKKLDQYIELRTRVRYPLYDDYRTKGEK